MSTVDLIRIVCPFWFLPIREAAHRAATALLESFSTPLEHRDLVTNLQWVQAGRCNLVQYLLHRMADQGRERLPAEQILNGLWWFLSNMQR